MQHKIGKECNYFLQLVNCYCFPQTSFISKLLGLISDLTCVTNLFLLLHKLVIRIMVRIYGGLLCCTHLRVLTDFIQWTLWSSYHYLLFVGEKTEAQRRLINYIKGSQPQSWNSDSGYLVLEAMLFFLVFKPPFKDIFIFVAVLCVLFCFREINIDMRKKHWLIASLEPAFNQPLSYIASTK